MPGLVQTYRRFSDRGVVWIGVTPEKPREMENVLQYVSELQIPWPIGYGAGKTFKAFGVNAIPRIFVIDRAGRIAWSDAQGGELDAAIERALSVDAASKPAAG